MTDTTAFDTLSLPDLWREHLRPRQQALSHYRTISRVDAAVHHWEVFAGAVAVQAITEQLVDKFRAWLLQSGLGKDTARNYHVSVRSMLREIDPERFPSRRGIVLQQSAESDGTLWQHVAQYFSEREVSAGYRDQMRWALADLERFHRRDLQIADLHPELINAWLHHMAQRGISDETRRSRRRMVLTIWKDAAELGLVTAPRRIGKVKGRDRIITTWTLADIRRLLTACQRLDGWYRGGLSKSAYWEAYVRAGWDTGLRGCDLRMLAREQIRPDGTAVVVQHKTGKRIRCRVRPATITAINATFPPARELCFPLWGRLEIWRREAARLVQLAGLTGSIGLLRHSSGTAVERTHPGRGHEHLGNTRQVFERHYLDLDQVAFERPLPPEL